jgi:hypothetical protein
MGQGTNLLLLLLCINFALYMVGYQSGFTLMLGAGLGSSASILALFAIVGITISTIGLGTGLLGGFALNYTIPLAVIPLIANFFFFPISFLASPGLPAWIGLFLTGFLNILLLGTMLGFMRGSDF